MRIGILVPSYPSESSSAYIFVHARVKLYIKDSEVKVFSLGASNRRSFEGVDIVEEGYKSLIKEINNYNPDVLCVHYPSIPLLQVASKLLHYPHIVWIHGHDILLTTRITETKDLLKRIKKRVLTLPRLIIQFFAVRWYLKRVDRVVFVSNWLKREGERHSKLKIENFDIIPNPIDTELFRFEPPKEDNISRGVSLRSFSNSVYGLDVAIRAFSNLEGVSLDIYGRGGLYPSFVKLAESCNSTAKIHNRYIDNCRVADLYSQYGFFVAPSRSETQGVAMCEAMSCGLPIIATKVGGIPEYVRDGIDGYLVDSDDPKALREAIERLVSDRDLFLKMGVNARENIMNVCSGEAVLRREMAVINEVLDRE